MEYATYLFITWTALLVLIGICMDRKLWPRKIFAGLIAIWMLSQLDAIDTAGLKATQVRVNEQKWNADFRDGVLMTMQEITSGQTPFKLYVLILLGLAVIPSLRKPKGSPNTPVEAA